MNFRFPRGREPFNGWSHLVASVLALIGAAILIESAWHQGAMLYAKIFFAATLIAAYASSAAYHLAITTPERLRILRNIDHACILALMIGTYIPLSVAMFSARENMFLISGFLALLAAGLLLAGNKNRRMVSCFYMTLASLPALTVPFLWNEHSQVILWFSFGSCFYLIGAYCYIRKFPKNNAHLKFHEIWHICVMLGSLVHYLVIYHLPQRP